MQVGNWTPEQQKAYEEQARIAMIENYRQACALQVMTALAVRADDDVNMLGLAKKAKRAADALVIAVFEE